MKNYVTQIFLFCVATVSLYIIIQIANLAVAQPRGESMANRMLPVGYAYATATPPMQNLPVRLETTRTVAESLAMLASPTVAEPSPTVPSPTPTAMLVPTQTPVPLLKLTPIGESVVASSAPLQAVQAAAMDSAPPVANALATTDVVEPAVQAAVAGCAPTSTNGYTLIPMEVADAQRPDSQHGDLNLGLRGYQPSGAASEFVSYNGDPDAGAPQWAGLFADQRRAAISSVYQVRDWRWDCGAHGCAADWLTNYDVTLMGVATAPGEVISVPSRGPEIYGGGYIAVVLYAEATRLTVAYTRDGTVAHGYAAHLENFCVDPNLLAQYRAGNAGGRHALPGLHNGQAVGTASSGELLVAIRDRGMFMDPRSARDWAR